MTRARKQRTPLLHTWRDLLTGQLLSNLFHSNAMLLQPLCTRRTGFYPLQVSHTLPTRWSKSYQSTECCHAIASGPVDSCFWSCQRLEVGCGGLCLTVCFWYTLAGACIIVGWHRYPHTTFCSICSSHKELLPLSGPKNKYFPLRSRKFQVDRASPPHLSIFLHKTCHRPLEFLRHISLRS